MNKKGDEILFEQIIFIVLNLVFFLLLLAFVFNSASGAFVTEQFYAKEIALLIDTAEPGTMISLDITDAYNIAKNNNLDIQNIINIENSDVIVKLGGSRAYVFRFFNDVKIEKTIRPPSLETDDKTFLDLFIKEKS